MYEKRGGKDLQQSILKSIFSSDENLLLGAWLGTLTCTGFIDKELDDANKVSQVLDLIVDWEPSRFIDAFRQILPDKDIDSLHFDYMKYIMNHIIPNGYDSSDMSIKKYLIRQFQKELYTDALDTMWITKEMDVYNEILEISHPDSEVLKKTMEIAELNEKEKKISLPAAIQYMIHMFESKNISGAIDENIPFPYDSDKMIVNEEFLEFLMQFLLENGIEIDDLKQQLKEMFNIDVVLYFDENGEVHVDVILPENTDVSKEMIKKVFDALIHGSKEAGKIGDISGAGTIWMQGGNTGVSGERDEGTGGKSAIVGNAGNSGNGSGSNPFVGVGLGLINENMANLLNFTNLISTMNGTQMSHHSGIFDMADLSTDSNGTFDPKAIILYSMFTLSLLSNGIPQKVFELGKRVLSFSRGLAQNRYNIGDTFEGFNKPYAFVSYSHVDKLEAMKLVSELKKRGYRVWMDQNIQPGSVWGTRIADAIEQSTCFVALFSKNYNNSSNCKDELYFARDKGRNILVICLDNEIISDSGIEMRTSRYHKLYYQSCKTYDDFMKLIERSESIQKCKNINDSSDHFDDH